MGFMPLAGGAYQARSGFAAAQRAVNLMSEAIPQSTGEPAPAAQIPTPGLRSLGNFGAGAWRGIWRASNGALFGVIGSQISVIDGAFGVTALGGALTTNAGPVSMADNGTDLVVVDGSTHGYKVTLANNSFAEIIDPAFYGADRVACIDGFFAFNRPGTNQFYLSDAIATTFNPLYVAAKAGLDRLVSLAVVERELWLLGEIKAEVYSNSGAADFPLQAMSGGIEYGCLAAHSVAKADGSVFWLGRSREGAAIVMQGRQYQAKRISTHAIDQAIQGYQGAASSLSDAVGWTYQLDGHTVYALTFPVADVTWAYDLSTGLWHQWASGNGDGGLHRHRGTCCAQANRQTLVGDWQNGNLYALEMGAGTDNGDPIRRIRSFPHIVADGNRVFHRCFRADMTTGSVAAGQPEPQLNLRWSDDSGATWGANVSLGMGLAGFGQTSLQFRRLGVGRNRVYELNWSTPAPVALLGAWLDTEVAGT